MPAVQETVARVREIDVDKYKYGFTTEIESVRAPKGLTEETVRFISAKKGEPDWLLDWRLEAYRRWLTMQEPTWANVHYPKIDFQDLYYYSAPKSTEGPKSLADVDPELLKTYAKLGIPLKEQKVLAGVEGARSKVRGSRSMPCSTRVSVVTTFKEELAKAGVIFCSVSEAVKTHPELVRNIWARWCPSPTISTPRSIRRCFPTAPSSMCRPACAARWSCRPISASMPRTPASSSGR